MITELTDSCIGVKVAEKIHSPIILKNELSYYTPRALSPIKIYDDLPLGSWELIGLAKDLTEDQWKGVVEVLNTFVGDNGQRIDVFVDYDNNFECDTAAESGLSLLKSKSLNPGTTLILKRK